MNIYEELQARGLIAQVTDEAEIKERINNGGTRFYIDFDPAADSLHLSTFEATKKWTMTIGNWGKVYRELSIMYEGRLPE